MMQQSINLTELQQDFCNRRMDLESCRDLRVEKLRDIIRKLKRSLKSFEDEERNKKQVMRGLVLRIKKNKFSKFKKNTKKLIVKDILRNMSEDEKGVKAMEKHKKKKTAQVKSIGTQTEMACSSNDNEDCIPAADAEQFQQQSEVKDSAAKDGKRHVKHRAKHPTHKIKQISSTSMIIKKVFPIHKLSR
ncbi:hypothetical protein CDAR_18171 [Caerostris darwini]|uniref:Uncharacterized protein n=1 Tax=Caerostris darwini TaxID=1538125 RepID=A0AAV4R3H5_9ARAC|nr:hypothetical protein CDAR_18171 [Caerostris darwini]